ncbi:MAG TPA: hypothetical protein VGE74_24270 [Gemmata sp.]
MRLVLSLAAALCAAPLAGAQDPPAPAPRRLLFVHAGGYLYLNPLTSRAPEGPDRARDAAERLAAALHVPTARDNDQLFVLADTTATDPHPPTKGALARALDGFCATTREQDRVAIYFGAHAVERDGKAFVVPLDGDPDAPDTLVPVADVYAKLKELKAAQKVVIWDVCRSNPDRVRGRRDGGPMSEPLFKALMSPPDGVEVLVSCSPGERGLELTVPRGPAALFAGSVYLDALRQAGADDFAKGAPGDAIPVAAWNKAAGKTVAIVADAVRAKQTSAAAGAAPKHPAAFDPKAPPAKRFALLAPPAVAPEVKSVLDELALPPILDEDPAQVGYGPLAADAMKKYAPDVTLDEIAKSADKYPLRVAALRALQAVRDVWPQGGKEAKVLAPLLAPVTEKTKKAISDAQLPLAEALLKLENELDALQTAAPHREKETKRWQAHYDYTLAEVRLRLVVLNEYNLLLARVRTETLPDLAPGVPGWRLVSGEKLTSRREIRDLYETAQAGFTKVAADYKGTPWEALAKRSRATAPGLRWVPLPPPKGEK